MRYEDLAEGPAAAAKEIFAFLGLEPVQVLPQLGCNGQAPACTGVAAGVEADVPIESVPPPLLARVNALLARLGYEGVSPVQGVDRLPRPAVR